MDKEAWLAWLQTFDGVCIDDLAVLADGQLLLVVMKQINPAKFSLQLRDSSNWVASFNNLTRLHRLLLKELTSLKITIPKSRVAPNLSLIAKDQDQLEIIKVLELILLVAISGVNREAFIRRIGSLPPDAQATLMRAIKRSSDNLEIGGILSQKEVAREPLVPENEPEIVMDPDGDDKLPDSAESLIAQIEFLQNQLFTEKENNLALSGKLDQLMNASQPSPRSDTESHSSRQYAELQNQFLILESQLAANVTHSAEQEDIIAQLKLELSKKVDTVELSRTLSKTEENQALLQAENSRLEVVNEKYRKKLTQDAAEAAVLEERILQLETRNRNLITELKVVTSKLEDAKRETHSFSAAEHVVSETDTFQDMSTSTGQFHRSESDIARTECLANANSSASVDATTTQIQRPNRSLGLELAATIEATSSAQTTRLGGDNVEANPVDAPSTRDKPLIADSYTRLLKQLISLQANELELLRAKIMPENSASVSAQCEALWQSQGTTILELRQSLISGPQVQSNLNSPKLESANIERDSFISSQLSTTDVNSEFSRLRETQSKMRRLLIKQDFLLKDYRQRYEKALDEGVEHVLKDEIAATKSEFAAFRAQAEKRDLQLRQENSLVAKAFYDLAAKYNALNQLNAMRSNATPKSFLGQRRAALGVIAPSLSRPR